MRNSAGLKFLAIIATAIAVGLGIGWYLSRPKVILIPEITAAPPAETTPATNDSTFFKSPVARVQKTEEETNVPPGEIITDWEDRVSDILGAEKETADKRKALVEIFPRLPEAGQVEVAHHISNLTSDEDYGTLAKIFLKPGINPEVADVLMLDAYNRPNSLRLPVMLEIARTPGHPKSAEALDMMQRILEDDLGTDWRRWENKLADWLKQNPD